ncbi:unnamed protein product, partial [Effrenium voratum]
MENLAYLRLSRFWEEQRARALAPYVGPRGLLQSQDEQTDFERFLERYLAFLRTQAPDYGLPPDPAASRPPASALATCGAARLAARLPAFDPSLRRNFALAAPTSRLEQMLFDGVVRHYEDFRQRMAFSKLRKLRSTVQSLPAATARQQVVQAVKDHQVVLVAGDTGCGKSTQVPQFLMEAGFRSILVTQPRRLAAVSLARRVAAERLDSGQVGHQIRFDSNLSAKTRILFVTEGILLRRLESDQEASDFEVIVVDEVHERHLVVDFVLGILREVAQRRPSLKLVLMSATLQKELFVKFFDLPESAVIEIPGRMFRVEVEHIAQKDEPLTIRTDVVQRGKQRKQFDVEPFLEVLRRIEGTLREDERGDVLIFVPGAYEIEALVGAISDLAQRSRRWLPLPLHSQMPAEQQDKVFGIAPQGVRKVVVATNIAETSVTIDGIRFVLDSGRMRGLDVDAASCVRHLSERWVSQANAEQRKGRAGRTGPGRCFRLFSERLFGEMECFSAAEVHRAALEGPFLQVLALQMDLHRFRLPEPPRGDAAKAALQRLLLMRAVVALDWKALELPPPEAAPDGGALVDSDLPPLAGGWLAGFEEDAGPMLRSFGLTTSLPRYLLALTPLGRVLSRLPVDVGVGKMLLLSLVFGVQSSAVVLASAMGLHSPRVQKHGERQGGRCHFDHKRGDLFTTLRVYQTWLRERSRCEGGSDSRSRRWCREHGLDERLLFELNKMNVQLCELLRDGAGPADGGASLGAVLRKKRLAQLQERMGGSLSEEEKEALRAELEELKVREAQRKQRLALEEGEGVLAEDERGMGFVNDCESGEDVANLSGGENNENRELNRRKRRRVSKPKPAKVRLPQKDGLVERMRRRNIEFELRYGSHRHTQKALETLTGPQEELLQLVVSCALYPNLALSHENNRDRCAAECVFHTRQVPFVNLHPSSVVYPQLPTVLGPNEGLAFGSILQTHMPFMTHVTRCPVVPVALLCAARVDVAERCCMLICDQWLQLTFQDSEEVLCLLEDALLLRRSIQRSLDHEVSELFEVDDDLPSESAEPMPAHAPSRLRRAALGIKVLRGQDLQTRALGFWHRSWDFRWKTLTLAQFRALQTGDAGAGVGAGSGWLRFGEIGESGKVEEALSEHLTAAFFCPKCQRTLRLNRQQIAQHRIECGEAGEVGWRCEQCGLCLPAECSALDILKHRRELLLAGACAGVASKTVTAPMDRIRMIFQVHRKRVFSLRSFFNRGMQIIRQEGPWGLWRGNMAVILQVMPYAGIQFMTFDTYQRLLEQSVPSPCLVRFSAGALAGASATTLTYPLDLLRAQMAISMTSLWDRVPHSSYTAAAEDIIRNEGVLGLYRGLGPTLLGILPHAGTSFLVFETLKPHFSSLLGLRSERDLPIVGRLLAGALAGLVAQGASYPLHVVRRRMQVQSCLQHSSKYHSVLHALVTILRTEGFVKGLYKGSSLTLIKGPLSAACGFTTNDFLKAFLLGSAGDPELCPPGGWPDGCEVVRDPSRALNQLTPIEHLISGGVAGAVAKTVIAPADRI